MGGRRWAETVRGKLVDSDVLGTIHFTSKMLTGNGRWTCLVRMFVLNR